MRLVILLIMALVANAECPAHCNCTTRSLSCELCLASYFQFFNVTSGTCACLPDFKLQPGGGGYCCPSTCYKCYFKGCASCLPNAHIIWNPTLNINECVCNAEGHYYLDGSECRCMAFRDPNNYYFDVRLNLCIPCPVNCTCNASGCMSCSPEALRTVVMGPQNLMLCTCSFPYVDIQGRCECYQGCQCTKNGITTCDPSSNRHPYYLTWECTSPYIEWMGTCQCLHPFEEVNRFGKMVCVCKSKNDMTHFYWGNGVCQSCPETCICTNRGCQKCVNPFISVVNLVCRCANNSRQVNGDCACVDPYYADLQNNTCKCLDILYPTSYYSIREKCFRCPDNCHCDSTGCFACDPIALRKVVKDPSSGTWRCSKCIPKAKKINRQCRCTVEYELDPVSFQCICGNLIYPNSVVIENGVCKLCPYNCICNYLGCVSCPSNSMRRMSTGVAGIQYCACGPSFIESRGVCVCNYTSLYNKTSHLCECVEPYFTQTTEEGSSCACKSVIYPFLYYISASTGKCQVCPLGCVCSSFGCIDCDFLTQRFIVENFDSRMMIYRYTCPCLQNAFFINNTCTTCDIGSYYNGDDCTLCPSCNTCDKRGCTGCVEGMTLVNNSCVCDNKNLTNVMGVCTCAIGQYSIVGVESSPTVACQPCPPYCHTCAMSSDLVKCLSCNTTGTNRRNIPQNNCPCSIGYAEAKSSKPYCCNAFCDDCMGALCTSCPLYTFRELSDGMCVCSFPFIDLGDVVCGCSNYTFFYNQTCIKCPPKCQTCELNLAQKYFNCTSCIKNSNRNTTGGILCGCLPGFVEYYPQVSFCYDPYCFALEAHCSKCIKGMIIDGETGLCRCKKGLVLVNKMCQQCRIEGCLKCISQSVCTWCNAALNYYLVETTCIKVISSNIILSQSHRKGVMIQIKINSSTKLNSSITATIFKIQDADGSEIMPPYPANIRKILMRGDTLSASLDSPLQQMNDVIISLLMTRTDVNTGSEVETINFRSERLLSEAMIESLDADVRTDPSLWTRYAGVMVFFLVAMGTALMSYKHNQVIFYIQTLSFIGYFLNDPKLSMVKFLFDLRISYLKFSPTPIIKVLPKSYMESSPGNFKWLTVDSNMLRIIEVAIAVAIIIIFMYVVAKLLYTFALNQRKLDTTYVQCKKRAFRMFEFLLKVVMYPILFFSFNSISNIKCQVFIEPYFKYVTLGVSIALILFFCLLTLYFYKWEYLSRIYRLEMVLEYLFDVLASILLPITLQTEFAWVPIVMLILISKDLSYYFLRKYIYRESGWIFQLQLLSIGLEILPPLLIYLDSKEGTMVTMVVALICQVTVQILVLWKTNELIKIEKLNTEPEDRMETEAVIVENQKWLEG